MKNILYLQGLESQLSAEKRQVLEQFGEVIAPDINYRESRHAITDLSQQYNAGIDCIIGSSMGGFAGFYLAMLLDVPALLFNPALAYRSVEQIVPNQNFEIKKTISIVVGALDTVVPAPDTKAFIKMYYDNPLISISECVDLEHQIPLHVFEKEVTRFFNR